MSLMMTAPMNHGDRKRFRSWLADLWTMTDLMKLFRKSELTVAGWVKNDGLPVERIRGTARDTLRFDREEVLAWARANGKRIFLQEDDETT